MHTVMDRDRRLTGMLRGQTDNVEAPPGFELNSAWRVGHNRSIFRRGQIGLRKYSWRNDISSELPHRERSLVSTVLHFFTIEPSHPTPTLVSRYHLPHYTGEQLHFNPSIQ